MATSRQSFFQAHWDWLVAIGGLLVLVLATGYLFMHIGESVESAEAACKTQLDAVTPSHEGVPPVDMHVPQQAYRIVKSPPTLQAVDAKRGSFLASERRVFCQKGDDAATTKACGRPIPADLEVCPFCGMKQHVVKVEVDSDGDGLPNDWEKKFGLNPSDPADVDLDSDGDGFTNREEFEAKTDPRDPKSHPDYLDSLSVAGQLQQTFLPFWFQSYTPIPDGYRFTLHRLDKNGQDVTGYNSTWSVKKDEPIGKTGFAITGFEKKSVLQVISGSKTGGKKNVDVSVLEVTRAGDGKKVAATIAARKIPVETQTELAYDRNKFSWKKTVSVGTDLDLNGEAYKVIKLRADEKGCEVTVENQKTKKQKVIR